MTEAEWLTATDPTPMLEFLNRKASERKLRLFAVGCCNRIRHLLNNGWTISSLEAAEMFADGLIGTSQLRERRVPYGRTPPSLTYPPTQTVATAAHELRINAMAPRKSSAT
jgi:hypothetical protein